MNLTSIKIRYWWTTRICVAAPAGAATQMCLTCYLPVRLSLVISNGSESDLTDSELSVNKNPSRERKAEEWTRLTPGSLLRSVLALPCSAVIRASHCCHSGRTASAKVKIRKKRFQAAFFFFKLSGPLSLMVQTATRNHLQAIEVIIIKRKLWSEMVEFQGIIAVSSSSQFNLLQYYETRH